MGLSRLPIHLGFLVFFGFIPLFSWFSENRSYKKQIQAGIVFAVVYTLVSLHWISLVTLGGFFGLFILFGFYFSLLFILINLVWNYFSKLRFLSFLCSWMAFEYLQNFGEFRFPWFNIGYSLADYLPFIQIAEIGGIYLISVFIISVSFLLWKMNSNFKQNFIILSILMTLWAGFGILRLNTLKIEETNTKISLVQASIPQEMKWQDSFKDTTVERYTKLTKQAAEQHPDMIIWPESALPVYTLKSRVHKNLVQKLANEIDADIFMGMPHYEFAGKSHPGGERYYYYNAATRFGKTGKIDAYYVKNILVPFGERMPFLKFLPFLWNVHLGQANWEYGTKQEFYKVEDYTYSPLICFEIAFEELTTKMAKHGVDFIVNITNDAWFRRSAGTYQHAVMTKIRAVETRRSIYRCANTGFSMIVSPTGEVLQQSNLFEQTILSNNLLLCTQNSFFTEYFWWFPIVFVFGAGIMLIWIIVKKKLKFKKSEQNDPVILSE
ncbi:MAG: apolipoprotein N-acyltransferase [Candidatus Cloacimonetes bacterium]|nr:apolipoprotein N-acyltransferase [Candidatus Cloacimonadota bacterium]MCF7883106.1 apolipoprotein N-acyltransferase [Candidatus Cloacimonadota bacterium]